MTRPGQRRLRILGLALIAAIGCNGAASEPTVRPLLINEVMTDNDSAWLDDALEVEDWIELRNVSSEPAQLERYILLDNRERSFRLPTRRLDPGATLVLFADDDAPQGELHMPWKLSAEGVTLELIDRHDPEELVTIDRVKVPALDTNEVYARFADRGFEVCRYASPERDNGEGCGPVSPPQLSDRTWPAYRFPEVWPRSAGPLALTELALRPARFVQVRNISDDTLDLRSYRLRIAKTAPGQALPAADVGVELDLGRGDAEHELAPGATIELPVAAAQLEELEQDPSFEGVVSLFDAEGRAIERVDFMMWPEGASLWRADPNAQRFQFCVRPVAGGDEDCEPLSERPLGAAGRFRHLYTPGDYDALAQGSSSMTLRGVKFLVDLEGGDAVHFLGSRSWALHYTFIREQIDRQPALDRCDAEQAQAFAQGWGEFGEREYVRVEGRRYLLGTLAKYAGSDAHAVDFSVGDQITGAQMEQAYFRTLANVDADDPARWAIHPTEPRQETALEAVAGRVPIMGANAPFRGMRWQPLTAGVALGQLMFIPEEELAKATLGPDIIVVTDAVPNDIPLVAGLITEAFQSPLAHVNVLSQSRGTPNLAVRDARKDPQIAALLGELVRLEVGADGYQLQQATAAEVQAHIESRIPQGPEVKPRLDLSVRGLVDLADRGLDDLPSIGAKAAQLAELGRVRISAEACAGSVPQPAAPFAVPIAHYAEHFEKSGARELFDALRGTAELKADPEKRARVLEQMRDAIEQTPLDPELLDALTQLIAERFGTARLRFRSSSNTEDLADFNGAGLYESWATALDDPERPIEKALRSVWASLWTPRAYDERSYGNIDQAGVGMGVLVHPAFVSERANVIVVSRDLLDPTRGDTHYMNAQLGEASVANPAPGVSSEELLHHTVFTPGTPEIVYRSQSSLSRGQRVLSVFDAQRLSCVVGAVHEHFRELLDPEHADRWFAMDIEAKLVGEERRVVIKQARPFNFGRVERPVDCREY